MDRIISIPSPDPNQDAVALARQQALLAQQALDDPMARHTHGKGGGYRHAPSINPAGRPLAGHYPIRPMARQLAPTLPPPLPLAHHGGHRLMLLMGRLVQSHPHHAAAILNTLQTLSPALLNTLLHTLSTLPKATIHALMSLITVLPPPMSGSLMVALASLPPVVVAGLVMALTQGDRETLARWLEGLPEDTQQILWDAYDQCHSPRDTPTPSHDDPPLEDEEESRRRLQEGWARWAQLLNEASPPTPTA